MASLPPRATDLDPSDKVLILGIPEPDYLRAAAARLTGGIIVLIADEDPVRTARRQFCELVNVMFLPGAPHEIPWHDHFFTKVIDTRAGEWPDRDRVAAEITRVLGSKSEID
jgi:hypothetical protein